MGLRGYFDLTQPVSSSEEDVSSSKPQLTLPQQVGLYIFVVLSIIAGRFLDLYRNGVADTFSLDIRYMLMTAIVSLAIFPVVYDKVKGSADQPFLVQIALIFTSGMGWEKIIATINGK